MSKAQGRKATDVSARIISSVRRRSVYNEQALRHVFGQAKKLAMGPFEKIFKYCEYTSTSLAALRICQTSLRGSSSVAYLKSSLRAKLLCSVAIPSQSAVAGLSTVHSTHSKQHLLSGVCLWTVVHLVPCTGQTTIIPNRCSLKLKSHHFIMHFIPQVIHLREVYFLLGRDTSSQGLEDVSREVRVMGENTSEHTGIRENVAWVCFIHVSLLLWVGFNSHL